MSRIPFPALALFFVTSCQITVCSVAGGTCDPRNANCPKGYTCSLAEVCTHACEQTSDCWIKVEDGCRFGNYLPGQRLPDGGVFSDQMSEDGFCPDSKAMECVSGFCQRSECAAGGCDYDIYGPSEFKGNRSQGPER
ncbi:MAG: hypothetical protein JNM17_03125 [Archangium sp.]|nr:hypothetical protein [Archangium sp.]